MENQQIVETLGNIVKDITKAKEALKANNVKPKTNATISLADEINKIPDSIKASDKLEGFNGGQNTLKSGFIYFNRGSTTELSDNNTMVVNADMYEVPTGKYLNLTFPPAHIANSLDESTVIKLRCNEEISNIYNTVLTSIYKTYLKCNLEFDYTDIGITQVSNRRINVLLKKENLTVENGVYRFEELVFPTFNTNFYVVENDEDKNGTLITKFDVEKFHFSLNYHGKDFNIKCNRLIVDLDFAVKIIKNDVSGHEGYHYMTNFEEVLNKYYNRREDSDCHIIYLPEFNVSYAGVDYSYNGLSLDSDIIQAGNIQIRTEENESNKELLASPSHIANILRLVKVYNMDGSKVYNPKTKEFEDVATSSYVNDYIATIDDDMVDKDQYYKDTSNVMQVKMDVNKPINYKDQNEKVKENARNFIKALQVTSGYSYYLLEDGSIPPDMIKYVDRLYVYSYRNFPMTNLLEGALRLKSSNEFSDFIDVSNGMSFIFNDDYAKSRSNVYPFITNCAFYPSDSTNYSWVSLYITADIVKEDGVKYSVLKNAVNTLVSQYNVKLFNNTDTDLNDSGMIRNIKTNAAPLAYNENVRTVKIVSDSKNHGKLKTLLGYGMIYQTFDPTKVPEVPASPMKYILDKDSTIEVSESETFQSKMSYQMYILGPYTTDEMAKYVDKYVHVLVPEDHPGLGTFEFCMYRLPLYNLDETKKYNYSKKTWEPVNALTDDSAPMSEIYEDAAGYGEALQVFQNQMGFPTEPTKAAPVEEYDHL